MLAIKLHFARCVVLLVSSLAVMSSAPECIGRNYFSTKILYKTCYLWLGPPLMAMRCRLVPILWMTSYFHIKHGIVRNQKRLKCFIQFARWQHQSDDRQCCVVEIYRWQHRRKVCRLRLHLVRQLIKRSSGIVYREIRSVVEIQAK